MKKFLPVIFLLVFTLSLAAENGDMFKINTVYPATPELIKSIQANITKDLGRAATKFSNNGEYLMQASDSDTLTEYYERMTEPRVFGINVNNQTYPMVGTNPIYYFVGQKFFLTNNQLGNYILGGVLLPYALNYTSGNYQDTSIIWVYSIDAQGHIIGGSPVAKGKVLLADITDTSMTKVLFSYAKLDSSGILDNNFVLFVQTVNFDANETDFVAIWANNQGDGMGESRSAFLAWDNQNQHWVAADFSALQIQMPDGNPPDFDVLLLPVIEPAIPDKVDEPVTINGLTFGGLAPNPLQGDARLDFALSKSTNLTVSLVSENGVLVKTIADGTFGAGKHLVEFNTQGLSSGAYMLLFRSPLSSFAVKAVIVK